MTVDRGLATQQEIMAGGDITIDGTLIRRNSSLLKFKQTSNV
jgi:hypothetical protein